MKIINITGEKFDLLDCSESNIFFEKFSEGEMFKLKIWGVTLMHELGISEKDSYIVAISDMVFEDVVYIVMNYGIYADIEYYNLMNNYKSGRPNNANADMMLKKRSYPIYFKFLYDSGM